MSEITGATGKQGGATLRHLATRGGFKLRALTRKPDGDAAKALAALGLRALTLAEWVRAQGK
jgi:uncharacterized protein YbjT (DUF2867 family)